MSTIGLIAAMPQESKALLRLLGRYSTQRLDGLPAYLFEVNGRRCRLVTCGMGARRAETATRALIAAENPRLLISFGVAGAVESELAIGDVVLGQSHCTFGPQGLSPVQALSGLQEEARRDAVDALAPLGARLVEGTVVTTAGLQMKEPGNLIHPLLEMETAGILAATGTPLITLRGVSDNPLAPIPFDLEAVTDADANLRLGRLLSEIMRHPSLLPALLRMGRNTSRAAATAAAATLAVLRYL